MLLCRTLFCAVLWIGELSQLLPKIKELVRSVFLTLDSHLFSEESHSVALTSVIFTVARAKGQFSCPIAWITACMAMPSSRWVFCRFRKCDKEAWLLYKECISVLTSKREVGRTLFWQFDGRFSFGNRFQRGWGNGSVGSHCCSSSRPWVWISSTHVNHWAWGQHLYSFHVSENMESNSWDSWHWSLAYVYAQCTHVLISTWTCTQFTYNTKQKN